MRILQIWREERALKRSSFDVYLLGQNEHFQLQCFFFRSKVVYEKISGAIENQCLSWFKYILARAAGKF